MKGDSVQKRAALAEIAGAQQGLFTSKQAREVGYGLSSHDHHAKSGNWVRLRRGIYRLADYPKGDDEQLMLWRLWSQNAEGVCQGVYSYETALRLHELSDLMPTQLHLTIPKSFRKSQDIPGVLILHKENLKTAETEEMRGFQVTKPLKTILDLCTRESISRDLIQQALQEGVDRGIIPRYQVEELNQDELPSFLPELIDALD